MSAIEPYTRRILGSVQPIIVANRAPLVLHNADPYRGTSERLVKGAGGLVTAMKKLRGLCHVLSCQRKTGRLVRSASQY